MGDPGARLSLRGVSKIYPGRAGQPDLHAIGPIDLDIAGGEFVCLVGPSGCGKSTLLDILAGLSTATSGTALYDGKAIAGTVPEGVGAVFQQDASFFWLNVWDNVAFGLRRRGESAAEVERRVNDVLSFMGLLDFAKAFPAQLSGGMRQRVCIARTLVLEPRLLLLDEPFGALDQQTRLLMGDELLRIWRQTGATVLFITHALDEAAMLADRVVVMSARPGRFIDVVATQWPRTRDSRIVSEAHFGAVTSRLWARLREESLRALASSAQLQSV